MKIFLLLFISTYFFFSCGNDPIAGRENDSAHYECIMPPPDSVHEKHGMPEVTTVCYRYDNGQQHNWIEITQVLDSAWGTLHYTFEEKDGRNGSFTGNFHGDTLWIIYDGIIEGHSEIREVAFLIKGDKLHEAQGTQELVNGVYRYTNRKLPAFTDAGAMVLGPCMQ